MRSGDFKQTYGELVTLTDSKPTWLWSAALVAALIVAPYVLNSYALSFVMIILITMVGALGLNILTGYTGLISLGHVGFLVTGAYAYAVLVSKYHLPPLAGWWEGADIREREALGLLREGRAEVDLHVVGRPMCRKERDWFLPIGADTDLLAAVAPVLGSEHQLSVSIVEIAFGPAVIGALSQLDELFSRQLLTLPRWIKLWPILAELVPSMLRGEDAAGRV